MISKSASVEFFTTCETELIIDLWCILAVIKFLRKASMVTYFDVIHCLCKKTELCVPSLLTDVIVKKKLP